MDQGCPGLAQLRLQSSRSRGGCGGGGGRGRGRDALGNSTPKLFGQLAP